MSSAPETHASPLPQNAVPVRLVAIDVFDQIIDGAQTLDRIFADHPGFIALNTLDRALVRMMVTTTIRRLGQIDDLLKMALNRDTPPEPAVLLSLLRLSVAQLLFMSMPDHAAVHVAVDVAGALGLERQKGLVNAVLRRLGREGREHTTRQDLPRLLTPPWMLKDWSKNFGVRAAHAAATALINEAPLDITVKDQGTTAHWATQLNATPLSFGTLRIDSPRGTIDTLPGYTDGAWWIQDAAASLPVRLMGNVAGLHVVDMCAAPGGKTMQLAAAGATVTALDTSAPRLRILNENVARVGLTDRVTALVADARTWTSDTSVDAVLLDAPCTATGTIRRHPDILHNRTAEDMARLVIRQDELLSQAVALVKPGGIILYAVCSLQHAEGEGQIAAFLKTHPDVTIDAVSPDEYPELAGCILKNGTLRLLPQTLADQGGMDGFFIARLRRNLASL